MGEITIKDRDDPRSLVNMITHAAFQSAIFAVPDELFEMSEEELAEKCKPSATDELIRMSFWNEYDLSKARGTKIDLTNVYIRSCTQHYFFKKFTQNSFKVAWLLTPPHNYQIMLDVLLNKGLEKQLEILNQPIIQPVKDKKTGEVYMQTDSKLAAVISKIAADIQDRKHGTATQRTVSVHHKVNHRPGDEIIDAPKDIDQKIKELESQLGKGDSQDAEYKEVK